MKIAICYEFHSPINGSAFRGLLFARGRAIVEKLERGRWRAFPTHPTGPHIEKDSFASVTTELMSRLAEEVRTLARTTHDRSVFDREVHRHFSLTDFSGDQEWFKVADAIGAGNKLPVALRPFADPMRSIGVEVGLHGMKAPAGSVNLRWVHIPVDTSMRFAP